MGPMWNVVPMLEVPTQDGNEVVSHASRALACLGAAQGTAGFCLPNWEPHQDPHQSLKALETEASRARELTLCRCDLEQKALTLRCFM